MAKIDLGKIKLAFEGEWDPNVTYELDDVVQWGGKLWINTQPYLANGFETFAPGDKGLGYKNHRTIWNTRENMAKGRYESDVDIDAYHSMTDDGNFHHNFKPVENNYEVETELETTQRFKIAGVSGNAINSESLPYFYECGHFSFYQNHSTNQGYALDFSLTADGTHGSGTSIWNSTVDSPLKYYLNKKEVTQSAYVASFATATLFNTMANRHRRVELHVPAGEERIYPFCVATADMWYDKGLIIEQGWIGHSYWDLMSMPGLTYRGVWEASKQYYWGDIVSYRHHTGTGGTPQTNKNVPDQRSYSTVGFYRALADSSGTPPQTSQSMERTRSKLMSVDMGKTGGHGGPLVESAKDTTNTPGIGTALDHRGVPEENQGFDQRWENLSGGNTNQQATIWANNMGRMNWPYKNANNSNFETYRSRAMIDKNGTVWNLGRSPTSGAENWSGHTDDGIGYWFEMDFQFRDWHESEDKNWFGAHDSGIKGGEWRGRHTNRVGKFHTPKCVQIERGWGFHYWLFDNGEVHHKGYGGHGQAGHGQFSNNTRPNPVQNLEGVHIIKISTGTQQETDTHTCMALDDKGQVWTWGYNGYGQLGNGRTENWGAPYKIPQEYFENKRIVDISTCGNDYQGCWARTQDDHLYCWGNNNSGWFCQNSTTDYWRPVKWSGRATAPWDPVANNGIACWQIAGYSSNQCVYILDGNGFVWHGGYNGYGNAGGSDTTNHHDSPTKATSSPNGDIVDIWCQHYNSYHGMWMRTQNGDTYHSGHSGGYYSSGDGGTGNNYPPVLIDKIKNLKEVYYSGTYSDGSTNYWLTDEGECFAQGRNNYKCISNPHAGDNWTGEDGTYKPYHIYQPAGTKISHIIPQGGHQSSSWYGMMPWFITEDGQQLVIGFSGHSSNDGNHCGGHNEWNYNSHNNGQMINPGIGR